MAKQTKKQVSIFLQSKGGVGKSWVSFFKMLNEKQNEKNIGVVLLDSSQKANQNLDRYTKILGSQNVYVWNIYNHSNEYKKSHFFNVFESIAELKQNDIILDVGAPESNVLREAIENDIEVNAQNLKFVADELNLDLVFNVVISGADDNVNENLDYFNALNQKMNGLLKVNCLVNDHTFKADKDAENLVERLIDSKIAKSEQIKIVGRSGIRNNDNPYLDIISVANAEKSLDDAFKSMATKIRLRNIFTPLNEL